MPCNPPVTGQPPPAVGPWTVSAGALRVPRSYPKSLLYAPLRSGGFGVPHLAHRLDLRYLLGALSALNSRNSLVRGSTRALLVDPHLDKLPGNDLCCLRRQLQALGCTISLPPHLLPAAREDHLVRRAYTGGPVILVSDGSAPPGRLGWGAVVADKDGVLASTSGGLLVDHPTSWAAEWHGKLAAVRLAAFMGIPRCSWAWIM